MNKIVLGLGAEFTRANHSMLVALNGCRIFIYFPLPNSYTENGNSIIVYLV